MTLRSCDYDDPVKIAIRKEQATTCHVCALNVKGKCVLDMKGYPGMTMKTCNHWRKRTKKSNRRRI